MIIQEKAIGAIVGQDRVNAQGSADGGIVIGGTRQF